MYANLKEVNQSYRNLSRYFRQYFYGDRRVEESFLVALRKAYTMPFWCETPVELSKFDPERRFADQIDREVELASLNYHPQQLLIYETQNKRLQKEVEDEAIRASGQETLEDQLKKYVDARLKDEQERVGPHARISYDRYMEIWGDALRRLRSETRKTGVDRHGEFDDFLEVRRPFIAPNNETAPN